MNFNKNEVTVVSLASSDLQLTLPFFIEEGYHIQTDDQDKTSYLFTTFTLDKEIEPLSQEFQFTPHQWSFEDGESFQVISEHFKVSLQLPRQIVKDKTILKGYLFYQACDSVKCYFPRTLPVQVRLK
ncbi:protein-disulfide reductase DsbD family protein [Galbibacter sp. EGI 63066]|uniref:protein-disulfide reductase DsbD family protein n=1 Tax=Galbibacter sp. EGI 63066 TaxID=2993559 RepID=UPI00224885E7|nr:protein-disulfide reductase DsbD family protein [Galbibacter sp. EGI 63066]MCX2681826.1 protein-disulfide reductase DsbD family protein [Galbibacter sp. EGI 63066]